MKVILKYMFPEFQIHYKVGTAQFQLLRSKKNSGFPITSRPLRSRNYEIGINPQDFQ